jgi:hypothetical protein
MAIELAQEAQCDIHVRQCEADGVGVQPVRDAVAVTIGADVGHSAQAGEGSKPLPADLPGDRLDLGAVVQGDLDAAIRAYGMRVRAMKGGR